MKLVDHLTYSITSAPRNSMAPGHKLRYQTPMPLLFIDVIGYVEFDAGSVLRALGRASEGSANRRARVHY